MKFGAVFPQLEIGSDPLAIRDYAQGVEALGYDYLLTYDHVLGAKAEAYPGQSFVYTEKDMFHEPFTLFSYMTALTERLEFVTGVLVLSQRNTVTVAKQAAQVSVLSGGRIRLGVGVGWNKVEISAMGYDPENRGQRIDEQIRLLKALWSAPLVTFDGEFHQLREVGLNPLPEKPIQIWIGGGADAVLKRTALLADGWIPAYRSTLEPEPYLEKLHAYLEEAGRSIDDFGIDMTIHAAKHDPDTWADYIETRKKLGMTHLRVYTMGNGFKSVDEHLKLLERFKQAVG